MNKYLRIVVVCGGISTERKVSLVSGESVYKALLRLGYVNVGLFDLQPDNISQLIAKHPDIVFLALHGKGGEDGCIQGLLELAGIPYTGPGVCCSAICMNKIITKRVLEDAGLPTAEFAVYRKDECEDRNRVSKEIISKIKLPLVLKSPCQGSSIGVEMVKEEKEMLPAIEKIFSYGDQLLAERFVEGIEITLPIMGNSEIKVLPVIEITFERDLYDFTAKYTPGLCHHIIPARIDPQTEKEVIEIGKKAYKVLDCCGLSRIDFIVDREKGPVIIEVNTLPGMTDMSLFPDAARYVGISYEDLVETILEFGIDAHRDFLK